MIGVWWHGLNKLMNKTLNSIAMAERLQYLKNRLFFLETAGRNELIASL